MRRYINLEFVELQQEGLLSYDYDLERVLDDWVLLSFLIGNDFLPHLPYFHINEDVLPTLFQTLKTTLAACDGYITDNGVINMRRLEVLLKQLSVIDFNAFVSLSPLSMRAGTRSPCCRSGLTATLLFSAASLAAAHRVRPVVPVGGEPQRPQVACQQEGRRKGRRESQGLVKGEETGAERRRGRQRLSRGSGSRGSPASDGATPASHREGDAGACLSHTRRAARCRGRRDSRAWWARRSCRLRRMRS